MTVTGYDGLNRPTGTPAISYTPRRANRGDKFGNVHLRSGVNGLPGFKGSLTSVSNTASTTSYGHDGFGRITGSTQTTGPYPPFNFTYGYSLTDTLNSIGYPSGRQVNYTLDAGDLVTAVQNGTGGGVLRQHHWLHGSWRPEHDDVGQQQHGDTDLHLERPVSANRDDGETGRNDAAGAGILSVPD